MPRLIGSAAALDNRFKTVLPEALASTLRETTRAALQGVLLDTAGRARRACRRGHR